MTRSSTRVLGAGAAALVAAALVSATPAVAKDKPGKPGGNPNLTTVQLLSFNDFHGHLEATDKPLSATQDPSQAATGGSEYLATKLAELRGTAAAGSSLTVAAGDLIGGSPFLSGLFHDEPAVESLNAMRLDVSSVGNHEFDEGTTELLRMQDGGCHPADGCYFPDKPYAGADFQWLAANVVKKDGSGTLLPGTSVKTVNGVKVGFIGMTLEATPTLVSPGGVATVDFKDEVETANLKAAELKKQGVKSIVVLLHEGGYNATTINGCEGVSQPIADIAARITPDVDQLITGHTHQGYVCSMPDPAGNPRLVTSAAQYGQAVTETKLVINSKSGEVMRDRSTAVNHLVPRTAPDATQTAIISKWKSLSDVVGNRVIGSVSEDITGDSSGNRGIETPMADLVADSILEATDGADGGAQIAFMNVGGVRASLRVAPKYTEAPNDVVYKEAYDAMPFGNRLVSIDMTGADIKEALEQQYQPIASRGSRPMLALGVSKGFTYTWDATQPQGSRVVAGSMKLDGVALDMGATYRVATLNFLQEGGDAFTAFTKGTNLLGGAEDLSALVEYLGAHLMVAAPEDRVAGL
ncbi:MAG: bifunctional metallophosphatase/5'-nucleotidase [Micrococcales bacterium]|nr:bifunctional metallophosphatase/5'-nucleotidase [Micrococcales bacterium]